MLRLVSAGHQYSPELLAETLDIKTEYISLRIWVWIKIDRSRIEIELIRIKFDRVKVIGSNSLERKKTGSIWKKGGKWGILPNWYWNYNIEVGGGGGWGFWGRFLLWLYLITNCQLHPGPARSMTTVIPIKYISPIHVFAHSYIGWFFKEGKCIYFFASQGWFFFFPSSGALRGIGGSFPRPEQITLHLISSIKCIKLTLHSLRRMYIVHPSHGRMTNHF